MQRLSVFFDTNVLVYAHDELSRFHEKSALLLELALRKEVSGVISEQNIMELYRVLTNSAAMSGKPLSPAEVTALIEETYLTGALKVVYPTKETMKKTLEIARRQRLSSAKVFDARLYALAMGHGPDYFVTYNTEDFRGMGEVALKTPDELI